MKQPLYHEQIDSLTEGGLVIPSVNALLSRPGMGRTKWALERAFYGSKAGTNTLFITLESSIQDSIERLFEIVGKEAMTTHPMTTFHIAEAPDARMKDVKNMITHNVSTNNVQVVWIDSLDYLIPENGLYMKEDADYLAAVRVLEELANELMIAIVFTRQFKRTLEQREDKRPLLTDVEPTEMSAHLTTIFALYRDELYHPNTSVPNTLEVRRLKHEEDRRIASYQELFEKKEQI